MSMAGRAERDALATAPRVPNPSACLVWQVQARAARADFIAQYAAEGGEEAAALLGRRTPLLRYRGRDGFEVVIDSA